MLESQSSMGFFLPLTFSWFFLRADEINTVFFDGTKFQERLCVVMAFYFKSKRFLIELKPPTNKDLVV